MKTTIKKYVKTKPEVEVVTMLDLTSLENKRSFLKKKYCKTMGAYLVSLKCEADHIAQIDIIKENKDDFISFKSFLEYMVERLQYYIDNSPEEEVVDTSDENEKLEESIDLVENNNEEFEYEEYCEEFEWSSFFMGMKVLTRPIGYDMEAEGEDYLGIGGAKYFQDMYKEGIEKLDKVISQLEG